MTGTAITGVHPYADKFPMLPEQGKELVGYSAKPHFSYVTIVESGEHPGYYSVRVMADGRIVSTSRPCSERSLIAEMVYTETRSTEIQWQIKPAESRESKVPSPRIGEPHVYFISDEDGYIKIGTARDVEARLQSLQTAARQELSILGMVPGDHNDESRYHELFAADRVRGEWFTPSAKLTHFIKEVCR